MQMTSLSPYQELIPENERHNHSCLQRQQLDVTLIVYNNSHKIIFFHLIILLHFRHSNQP